MTAGAPTIGGLVRLSQYMAGQRTNAIAVTGGAIDGTPIGATTRSTVDATRLADNVETGSTTTNLLNYGTSLLTSTAATTYTLDAPTKAGIYKYLHSNSASTLIVSAGIQVGTSSTLTRLTFAGNSSIALKSESTSAWFPYGAYNSTLITLSS